MLTFNGYLWNLYALIPYGLLIIILALIFIIAEIFRKRIKNNDNLEIVSICSIFFCIMFTLAIGVDVGVEAKQAKAVQAQYDAYCDTGYEIYLDGEQVDPQTISPLDYRPSNQWDIVNKADKHAVFLFTQETPSNHIIASIAAD